MSFLENKKLLFFDKNGHDANFTLEDGVYKGSFYLPEVSTFLISNLNIFIYEVFDVNGEIAYGQPQDISSVNENTFIRAEYSDKEDKRWSFYSFEEEGELKVFTENQAQINSTDPDNFITGNVNGISTTNNIDSEGIKIKASFASSEEGSFINTINIYADNQDTNESELIAEISLYVEVEEEDERLGSLINNFYKDIEVDQQDFFIFRDVDIKEGYPDWTIINSKLKELLLNGANLKNYQGSYRGLITAIRYFGYDSLRINEYFKNVNPDSDNFGKLKFKSIADQFDGVIDPFYNNVKETLPNKNWKKTSNFGLAYDLNRVVKNEFDEFGLPLVEDAFDFSNEEILIKLQGLKDKLKSKFLPLSARIISITGEGNYFTKFDINSWSDINERDVIDVGVRSSLEVYPKNHGFIINLNPLLVEIDSIVRQDEQLVIPTQQTNTYSTALNNIIPLQNTAIKIDNITVNGNSFFIKGLDYILDGSGNNLLWTSDTFPLSQSDTIIIDYTYSAIDIPLNTWNPNPTLSYNKLKESIVDQSIKLDQKYTHTFIDFIVNNNDVYGLNDDEDTPVGCPVTLTNTTFGFDWDDMAINWDVADEGVNGSLTSWDTIKFESYYEVEWIVKKRISEDSPQEWNYSLRGNIAKFESLNIILPYKGVYDIKMNLFNTFNTSTSETAVIEVEQKNPEIIANHKASKRNYTWKELDAAWDSTWFTWAVNLIEDLKWDDADIHWNSTDKAKYSNPRNYNNLYNYTLDDIANGLWNELDHLWWEGTADAVFYNPFNWEDYSLKKWNDLYKNQTWDGNLIASDSPSFFEIFSVNDINSSIKIGKRVPKTFISNEIEYPYKYKFMRFTDPVRHPEGNLLAIKDSLNATLLTISRTNNFITAINGIDLTNSRGYFYDFNEIYDGSNILLNKPEINDELKISLNDNLLTEGTDFDIIQGNPQSINWLVPISNGDIIDIQYYSLQRLDFKLLSTVNFDNQSNNQIEITDTSFLNTLNLGSSISLVLNISGEEITLNRFITNISGNIITYSGANRNNIVELKNPNEFNFIYQNVDNPPLKESALKIITSELAVYDADLHTSELERQVFEVEGDTLELSNSATDLEIAYQEIVSTDLPNFKKYNWNIVYEEDETTVNRIQATSKLFGESQESHIEYINITGDNYAPALTLNYNWSELRVFNTRKKLPLFSQVIFSYDNSKIPGKQLIGNWELTEVATGEVYTLSENYFSHFFNSRGEYILKLEIKDSNNNTKELVKQGLVVIE